MITLTNFTSGGLLIADDSSNSLRLSRDQANRLILTARMHTIQEFVAKLSGLIENDALRQQILALFDRPDSSGRWNLKEQFARLQTLAKGYEPEGPEKVVEVVEFARQV